jgi:hypothetical protein
MFKLKLPILNNTDETSALEKLDIEINYNDCAVGQIIFYEINAISNVNTDGTDWTEIFSNGRMFISPLLIDEIEKLIDEQHKLSHYLL